MQREMDEPKNNNIYFLLFCFLFILKVHLNELPIYIS